MSFSRRDLLKYGAVAGAATALGDASWGADQVGRPPIGLALCIGLNCVDANCYQGWKGRLRGCVPDAEFMSSIFRTAPAGGTPFKVRTLWDKETAAAKGKPGDVGTLDNVRKYITRAAKGSGGKEGLQAGDIF